jgi:uncharacterized membrane protein
MILSAILGLIPTWFTVRSILSAIASASYRETLDVFGAGIGEKLVTKYTQQIVGGLVILFFILAAIWVPAGIIRGIRKLIEKRPARAV